MITYELVARPNAYGFGKDWTLVLTKGTVKKSFWLGQDVKVVSRILGMSMANAVEFYKNKANSSNFEVIAPLIASDILRTILDTQRLDQDKLEQVFSMNSWEMSIE
jgi:hypothetical protein